VTDFKRWANDGVKTEVDFLKREASEELAYWALDSLSAYYRMTTLLMYMQVAAFVVNIVGLIGQRKRAPPPQGPKDDSSEGKVLA
jgi:hypothetical protein